MFKVTIITLFTNMFPPTLETSILGRAKTKGLWDLEIIDIRTFATDKHKTVDDTPYGGGAGMVIRADIVAKAIRAAKINNPMAKVIYMSASGIPFKQETAKQIAKTSGIIILCGHYEGIDQRVLDTLVDTEICIGDYVLTGGEIPAMVVTDAIVRLLPNVLGNNTTLDEESFENNMLEYPHYTRPENWEGQKVPEVLTSGHHGKIATWRKEQSEKRTRTRRPDLL